MENKTQHSVYTLMDNSLKLSAFLLISDIFTNTCIAISYNYVYQELNIIINFKTFVVDSRYSDIKLNFH